MGDAPAVSFAWMPISPPVGVGPRRRTGLAIEGAAAQADLPPGYRRARGRTRSRRRCMIASRRADAVLPRWRRTRDREGPDDPVPIDPRIVGRDGPCVAPGAVEAEARYGSLSEHGFLGTVALAWRAGLTVPQSLPVEDQADADIAAERCDPAVSRAGDETGQAESRLAAVRGRLGRVVFCLSVFPGPLHRSGRRGHAQAAALNSPLTKISDLPDHR